MDRCHGDKGTKTGPFFRSFRSPSRQYTVSSIKSQQTQLLNANFLSSRQISGKAMHQLQGGGRRVQTLRSAPAVPSLRARPPSNLSAPRGGSHFSTRGESHFSAHCFTFSGTGSPNFVPIKAIFQSFCLHQTNTSQVANKTHRK